MARNVWDARALLWFLGSTDPRSVVDVGVGLAPLTAIEDKLKCELRTLPVGSSAAMDARGQSRGSLFEPVPLVMVRIVSCLQAHSAYCMRLHPGRPAATHDYWSDEGERRG